MGGGLKTTKTATVTSDQYNTKVVEQMRQTNAYKNAVKNNDTEKQAALLDTSNSNYWTKDANGILHYNTAGTGQFNSDKWDYTLGDTAYTIKNAGGTVGANSNSGSGLATTSGYKTSYASDPGVISGEVTRDEYNQIALDTIKQTKAFKEAEAKGDTAKMAEMLDQKNGKYWKMADNGLYHFNAAGTGKFNEAKWDTTIGGVNYTIVDNHGTKYDVVDTANGLQFLDPTTNSVADVWGTKYGDTYFNPRTGATFNMADLQAAINSGSAYVTKDANGNIVVNGTALEKTYNNKGSEDYVPFTAGIRSADGSINSGATVYRDKYGNISGVAIDPATQWALEAGDVIDLGEDLGQAIYFDGSKWVVADYNTYNTYIGTVAQQKQQEQDKLDWEEYKKALMDANQAAVDKSLEEYKTMISQAEADASKSAAESYLSQQQAQRNATLSNAYSGDLGGIGQKQYDAASQQYDSEMLSIALAKEALVSQANQAINELKAQGRLNEAELLAEWYEAKLAQYNTDRAFDLEERQVDMQADELAYNKALQMLDKGFITAEALTALGIDQASAQAYANRINEDAQTSTAYAKAELDYLLEQTKNVAADTAYALRNMDLLGSKTKGNSSGGGGNSTYTPSTNPSADNSGTSVPGGATPVYDSNGNSIGYYDESGNGFSSGAQVVGATMELHGETYTYDGKQWKKTNQGGTEQLPFTQRVTSVLGGTYTNDAKAGNALAKAMNEYNRLRMDYEGNRKTLDSQYGFSGSTLTSDKAKSNWSMEKKQAYNKYLGYLNKLDALETQYAEVAKLWTEYAKKNGIAV